MNRLVLELIGWLLVLVLLLVLLVWTFGTVKPDEEAAVAPAGRSSGVQWVGPGR